MHIQQKIENFKAKKYGFYYRNRKIIKVGSKAAAGVGVIGAATTDLPALAAIWGTMIYKIANENYVTFDKDTCIKIAASVIAGGAAWMGGCAVLTKILTWSGVGLLLGVGLNCATNYFYTWRLGVSFDEIFDDYDSETAVDKIIRIAVLKLAPIPTLGEFREFWNDLWD